MVVRDQTGKQEIDAAKIERYQVRANSTGRHWTIAALFTDELNRLTVAELGLYDTENDARNELRQIAAACLQNVDRYQVRGTCGND